MKSKSSIIGRKKLKETQNGEFFRIFDRLLNSSLSGSKINISLSKTQWLLRRMLQLL